MKPYLVDVPVKINIWTRPECQRKQFEVIKQARPSILFVTSDGGRNEREWQLIYQNRKIYDEEIDWDCKVYKLYMDHNLGMYAMGEKRTELIWNTVDRCIMLEDDILPSVSFFQYCAELLEKYKDDERIECICGMNHLGKSENVLSDYFFSRQGSIWGFAVWKRTIKGRGDFSYFYDSYVMELLKQRTRKNPIAWKRLCAYGQQEKYEGHVASSEFWYEFDMYAQNRVQIVVFLDVQFGNMNELKLKSVYGAFMYPLLIQNGAAVRKELQKERIYIPTLWPNVLEECPSNSLEYHYAADILPIPVDQRYEIEDMKYLVEVIKVVSSERT